MEGKLPKLPNPKDCKMINMNQNINTQLRLLPLQQRKLSSNSSISDMCFKKMRNDPYIKAFKNPMKRQSAKISSIQENNWDSKIAYSDPIK